MIFNSLIHPFRSKENKRDQQCQSALLSAVINPRFHKARQQIISRFLNAYVRYMFDSVKLGKEIQDIKQDSMERISDLLRSTICTENPEYTEVGSPEHQSMLKHVTQRATETCNEAVAEAKRKAHQFSQLSQSVLLDQRNHLLLSKALLLAKKSTQDDKITQLSMLKSDISPADAFAAKLLEDSETHSDSDNVDILCYASLAEGIRSVAKSQMNHFFQMHQFEQEHSVKSFNGISSDEILEQLELDVTLVMQYEDLISKEQSAKHAMPKHSEGFSANLSDSF